MRILWRATPLMALCAALAVTATACGDDTSSTNDGSDTLFDPDAIFPDTLTGQDTLTPTDTTPADTLQADTTPVDTMPADLVPDLEAPYVVSTTPADGAGNVGIPFTVTITFNEPLYEPTVASQSIKVYASALSLSSSTEVAGTPVLGADKMTVTWTPTNPDVLRYASPYTIKIFANIIADATGSNKADEALFTFTTANYPDQDGYRDVAAAYAPVIYSAVDGTTAPYAQVPTKLDSDGNWDLSNNRDWLTQTATSLIPAVYFNVAETRTHYFIHYMLYFPWVNDPTSGYAHANGAVGYLVTVEKARGEQAERPIAVHSYFRQQLLEENLAFITTESGIVADGGASTWWADAEMDQADLFPDGHFEAYVSARTHRACLWGWNQSGGFAQCPWPSEVENGNKLVFAYQGGSPTPYQKQEGVWPKDMADITGTPESLGYALIPMLSSVWPRRFEAGPDKLFDDATKFNYTPDTGHTVGAGLSLRSKFINPMDPNSTAYGRPLWAWDWKPNNVPSKPEAIEQGQMAIDPAWYVWERHKSSLNDNGLVTYNESDGTGFSTDYCFNGIANIDVRTTDSHCH